MRKVIPLLILIVSSTLFAQKSIIKVEKPEYTVWYDIDKEQPIRVIYNSTNRPKNLNRGNMDFHTDIEIGFTTADNDDFKNNVWDKGHMAPAASFSDTEDNLYQTFSYLNASLQHQSLNRGQWRVLEMEERRLDNNGSIRVEIIIEFENSKILPSGAHVPSAYHKHITIISENKTVCYYFKNKELPLKYTDYINPECHHLESIKY